jgi:hypothetical protein
MATKNETLELMFKKLEKRLERIELLLKNDLAADTPERVSFSGSKARGMETSEEWGKEMQFYCNHKLMDEGNVVVCGTQHIKKVCSYDNCPLKNILK